MTTIILDLETCPITDAAGFVEDPAAPSNYKDEAKIAAYIAAEKAKLIDRTSLDLDLARVACLGTIINGAAKVMSFQTEAAERAGLEQFFDRCDDRDLRLVTFNGFKFDLPLLQRRAAYLGLPPWRPNLDRFRSPHLDVWQALTLNGQVSAHSLSWYIKRLGWTDLSGTLDGAEIPGAIARGEWAKVEAHCLADVQATERLGQWFGLLPKTDASAPLLEMDADGPGF